MKFKFALATLALLGAAVIGGPASAQTQGVSKDRITLGSIQDLSGAVALFSKQLKNGMQLRVDEANEQGGINGRKLVIKYEDAGYDPARALLAAQKLVSQEKVFMMIANIGTAPNVAIFPALAEKNIVNYDPISAALEMYAPPHEQLKYSFATPYYDQIRVAAPRQVKEKGAKQICLIYQDDDFGLEVRRGAQDGLKTIGMKLAETASFKRGATDFSSQVARMKAANCDFVVLGTIIRETVAVMNEARKTGFNPTFLGSSAAYTELVHKLGGKATDGLYAVMTVQTPYIDDSSPAIRAWAAKYKAKFGEDPAVYSVYGYEAVDTFVKAALKVGPDLTTENFIKTMDSITLPTDIFGSPEFSFSPTKRLGSQQVRLSQIQNGRWKVVSDYWK